MSSSDRLLAWIEPGDAQNYVLASFIAAPTVMRRAPARYRARSHDEARKWIETQAAELGVPLEWVEHGERS